MVLPMGFADLVADQPIDRLGVGHPQQCFRQAQQRDPLGRGQRIFMEEGVNAAFADAFAADIGDKDACPLGDSIPHLQRDVGRGDNAANRLGFIDPAAVANGGA